MTRQYFYLIISGDPKNREAPEKLVRAVSRFVLRVDNNNKFEYTHFAKLTFRFVWSGVVKDINKIDDLHKLAMSKMREFLLKWEYRITIRYIEEGEKV